MTNHTIKIIFLALLVNISVFCQQDSLQNKSPKSDSVFVMTKSPWGAVLRSALVPGLGQIYNESYWKAPVVWGISAWLIYNWIDNNRLYRDLQKPGLTPQELSDRDFYHDQRDLFSIYMGIAYLLNLVDAYVDAQLFDFSVDENFYTSQPMFGIKVKF